MLILFLSHNLCYIRYDAMLLKPHIFNYNSLPQKADINFILFLKEMKAYQPPLKQNPHYTVAFRICNSAAVLNA